LQRQKDFQAALTVLERSYAISEQLNDRRGLVMVLNNLGFTLQGLHRFEQAEDKLRRGYAIAKELGDRLSLSLSLKGLCRLLQVLGRSDFIRLAEELDEGRTLAIALTQLAGELLQQHDLDEAVEAVEQSIKVAEHLNLKG
jgi:tetratricopeptide (TPR) repeat protein